MEAFPDAKVVLTVRKASTWPESVKNAIMRSQRIAMTFPASWIIWIRGATDKLKVSNLILLAPPISLEHTVLQRHNFSSIFSSFYLQLANQMSLAVPRHSDHSMFSAVRESQEEAEKWFQEWVEEVKRTVPKEKLLIFDVREVRHFFSIKFH